ncbi:MAG: TetR/AcrR family transcriptional regulator [Actinomycetota bacterium]
MDIETSSRTSSQASPRRQARSATTRASLVEAALHEFAAQGFEAASTRAIARAAGTQQPQINYHFDSKEALWKAALDHLFQRLDESIERHAAELPEPTSARDRVATIIRSFVRAAAELPELNRIMVHESTVPSDRLRWIVERHTRPRFEFVIGEWRTARANGDVPSIDEGVLYYSLVGAASLAYVNAPEAQLLGYDTLAPSFIDAHADALVSMFLPEPPISH